MISLRAREEDEQAVFIQGGGVAVQDRTRKSPGVVQGAFRVIGDWYESGQRKT